MESIVESLKTEAVPRLRVGVGPASGNVDQIDLAEFVLAPFTAEEMVLLEESVGHAVAAAGSWLAVGLDETMNRFNG